MNKFEIQLTKAGFKDVFDLKTRIRVKRQDGFIVFLDKVKRNDPDKDLLLMLNKIRLTAPKQEVIMAVGLVRGVQIARNYAKSYAKKDTRNILSTLTNIVRSITNESNKTRLS